VIPIYPYQTQEVRDLAWACFSPSLLLTQELLTQKSADDGQNITECGLALTPPRRAWLEALDRDASALLEHLSKQRSHRLGIYFEHLWHFFLEQDPATDLVAHNLPIHHHGKTLGEFDCIYFCRERQRHFHLELAVKFFLSHRQASTHESASHWNEWLGPNTDDRLDRKIEHLMQHQIKLGDNPVAREQLRRLGIFELDKEVEIKGYLFQSTVDPLPPPTGFNPAHRLNQYVELSRLGRHLDELGRRSTSGYLILPRAQWLAAARTDIDTALCQEELLRKLYRQLTTLWRPQLVAALDRTGEESQRFFVTPPLWPACPPKNPFKADAQ
jgi:hypothetical protein